MNDVDIVKKRADIVEIIGGYIKLNQAGRNFKAVCPFHSEKSPSFVVSPDRQIWHCFGCAKGGDVFTFLQEYERMDFLESLKLLAKKYNITLTNKGDFVKKDNKKNTLFEINNNTAKFYHYLLTQHPVGKNALNYLIKERDLTLPLIETYQIGFTPGNTNALSRFLQKKGFLPSDLVTAGVTIQKNGRLTDFFQNRIIFPIFDHRGNILAFSGRTLTNSLPKYINTKETPLYVKGETLFGLYQARDSIKKEGKTIVMEGEFDVISSFKNGISNSVAVKGTALTQYQIRLLKRFCSKLVFCFDTDSAGIEAQRRSISLASKEDLSLAVVTVPLGKDPDEVLKENPPLFKKALDEEVNIYDFIIESYLPTSIKDPYEKKAASKKILSFLAEIDNEIIKEHYMKKLATRLDVSLEAIQKESDKIALPEKEDVVIEKSSSREEKLKKELFATILQSDNIVKSYLLVKENLQIIPFSRGIFKYICDTLNSISPETNRGDVLEKLAEFIDENDAKIFNELLLFPTNSFENEQKKEKSLKLLANDLKTIRVRKKLTTLSTAIDQAEKEQDEEKTQKLQKEFDSLKKHHS